jgi:hypothetical protein
MDTDAKTPQPGIPREVDRLMRLLANLNAGAMLALGLWLAWAAMDYSGRNAVTFSLRDCGCVLTETGIAARVDIAAVR